MITTDNMPQSYKPFTTLKLCSNIIINYCNIISIGNVIPLILGQGDKPMIWLQAVINPRTNQFITIVDASISQDKRVKIVEDKYNLIVNFAGNLVLEIRSPEEGMAIVDKLDLRPLGLNVFGDASKLQAGGLTLSNSTFQGVGTVIALGGTSSTMEAQG